jgi:hypothetical protein
MKKVITSIITALAVAIALPVSFTGCETFKAYTQSDEFKAQMEQLKQWAIEQTIKYFEGNLMVGKKALTPKRYSVAFTEQQMIATAQSKFPAVSRDKIAAEVHAAFTKESLRH